MAYSALRQFHQQLLEAQPQAGCPGRMIRENFCPLVILDYKHVPVARRVVTPFAWHVAEFCFVVRHYGEGRHENLARWQLRARQKVLFC